MDQASGRGRPDLTTEREPASERARAFSGHARSAARWFARSPSWWSDHYDGAASAILDFLRGDGIDVSRASMLDVGCGDGIITCGLAAATTADVVGVDLQPIDREFLERTARLNGVEALPVNASFRVCEPNRLPFPDDSFDIVSAWSVFEHVADPGELLGEIRRVLRAPGHAFVQVWPLWHSQHGAHLWPWVERGHEHLVATPEALGAELVELIDDPMLLESVVDLVESCNHATIDDLQSAIIDAGFYIAKVSVAADTFHVRPELQRVPLSKLSISGFQMLLVKQ